ncbi:MAG: TatD family deoxyribonuclease [Acholeplasmataceae bacterium]|nr:MAG: TatD family deoxyribonuclease [Acholeplasmataceae bacterium]
MIVDTHAHLNTPDFHDDLDEVLARARQFGVTKTIVIGMNESANHQAIEMARNHDMLFASVGVHPADVDHETTAHLKHLVREKEVVAIGECGIDLYWRKDNLDTQRRVFIEQIELAVQTGLPLIIHTRNSFPEAYACLLPYRGRVKGVFHCFSAGLDDARRALDLGFHIGIGGPVTFPKSYELTRVVRETDLSWLLVETDSPYLAPHPYRGKRNEPGYTIHVATAIAAIKGISVEEVARQTTHNAHQLFQLGGNKT